MPTIWMAALLVCALAATKTQPGTPGPVEQVATRAQAGATLAHEKGAGPGDATSASLDPAAGAREVLGLLPPSAEDAAAARAQAPPPTAEERRDEASHLRRQRQKKLPVAGVVNVNRASEAELRLLPGIGKGRARAIVERRDKHPFASLDELARVKGLKGVVRKLRKHLAVQGDTTVHRARP